MKHEWRQGQLKSGINLHSFAAARDHAEHRRSCRYSPHIVLQLRHIFFHCRFLGEIPVQAALSEVVRRRAHSVRTTHTLVGEMGFFGKRPVR